MRKTHVCSIAALPTNPNLTTIWIGFSYDYQNGVYVYADGSQFDVSQGRITGNTWNLTAAPWLPAAFWPSFKLRFNPDGTLSPAALMNCVISSQGNNYNWQWAMCTAQYTYVCWGIPRYCQADGLMFPMTLETQYVQVQCRQGSILRQCLNGGQWGVPNGVCQNYVGETCEWGQQCMANSVCVTTATSATCNCLTGWTQTPIRLGNESLIGCTPLTVYVGDSCVNGQICGGGSVCIGSSTCMCPAVLNNTINSLNQSVCTPFQASAGEMCETNYINVVCVGGSVCVANIQCQCPLGTNQTTNATTNATICASVGTCPAQAPWPTTTVGQTGTAPCPMGGQMTRNCIANNTWGSNATINAHLCQAYVNQSCAQGQMCLDNSMCGAQNVCTCAT
jgi:hypothetical protein